MAPGKIHERADVDHDRTRRLLAAKFVDRELRELRRSDAVETGSALVHRPQAEKVRRIRAQAAKEVTDKCILASRGKQRGLMALLPKGRRPLPAGAGRAGRARSAGRRNGQASRKFVDRWRGR